jgi:hypothetical protein
MYTLAQTESAESDDGTIYIVVAPWFEEEYLSAGYQKHERSYKLIYQHNEYTVVCPEYRNNEVGVSPIVVIPAYLIPRRPYPVQVYLYAIDLYSSNPAMGQREASETTRKHFGLPHFAHTTLGRALKVFVRNVEESGGTSGEYHNDKLCEADEEDAIHHANGAKCDEDKQESYARKQFCFPTTQATATWRKCAVRILEGKISCKAPKQFIEACFELAKEWFNRFCRFLL